MEIKAGIDTKKIIIAASYLYGFTMAHHTEKSFNSEFNLIPEFDISSLRYKVKCNLIQSHNAFKTRKGAFPSGEC